MITMKRPLIAAACAAAAAAAISVSPAAHADDQTYLDYLSSHQIGTLWMTPADKTSMGHMICGWIRGGQNPADIAQQIKAMDGPAIVGAAQHELCPDTLSR
jgi:hypothetical protein